MIRNNSNLSHTQWKYSAAAAVTVERFSPLIFFYIHKGFTLITWDVVITTT